MRWLVGQAVKTLASHAENMGSIPVRVTTTRHLKRGVFFRRGDSYVESHPATYVAGVAYAAQSASSSLVSGKRAYIQFR